MSSELAISVRNLSKVYDLGLSGRTRSVREIVGGRIRHPIHGSGSKREKFHALDNVSFDVKRGEAVGVVGKNGAGKSTLLKILSRITPPSSGYVDLVGTVGSLLEVGTGFHPELTGTENVYLNGTILGMSTREIDRRFEEIAAFAEVDKFLATPVKRYSSGMRVRLAFAVAAHLDPEILIVDEVLSVGDYAFQAKCLKKMRSIATDEGRTVFYVTHNLVTLENLCPRSMLLVDGRLAYDGTTTDTLSQYLQLFPTAQHNEIPGIFDLASADRSGTIYQPVFRRLELRPGGSVPSDSVRVGESLQVQITVAGLHEIPEALLMVTVGSDLSECLFRMTSSRVPLRAAMGRRTEETIVMSLPALPLTPGDYHLNVHLKTPDGTVDFVRDAATFRVVPADLHGNGYQFAPQDGSFVVPWEWEIRPAVTEIDLGATR
jgi:lipopolysaccharide transport system ATP-binding protein